MDSFRKTILIWAIATVALCTGYVFYVRTLPTDELVMANTLSFQIATSIVVVGGPLLLGLFLALLFGAIFRSLRRSNRTVKKDASATRLLP
jgi:hypothetical protein